MPQYLVTIRRTTHHYRRVAVDMPDARAAAIMAEQRALAATELDWLTADDRVGEPDSEIEVIGVCDEQNI